MVYELHYLKTIVDRISSVVMLRPIMFSVSLYKGKSGKWSVPAHPLHHKASKCCCCWCHYHSTFEQMRFSSESLTPTEVQYTQCPAPHKQGFHSIMVLYILVRAISNLSRQAINAQAKKVKEYGCSALPASLLPAQIHTFHGPKARQRSWKWIMECMWHFMRSFSGEEEKFLSLPKFYLSCSIIWCSIVIVC